MLRFITNGNYIELWNLEDSGVPNVNNPNYYKRLFNLHNTSKCIDWSLPSNTNLITFTIDETKFPEIPITSVYFDGVAMNSQDDFETGITAMFPGLAGGSPGGSGLTLESYQNSAMSADVMAYVFRDEDDNIFQVYEPIRNNVVSRSQYSYADSIDKFPFDSAACYRNNITDVKLLNVGSDVTMQKNTLRFMVIDGGSFTGLQINNTIFNGNYGTACPNGAEIHVVGNSVLVEECSFLGDGPFYSSFIDSIGANSQIVAISSSCGGTSIYIQGHLNCYVGDGTFYENFTSFYVYDDFLAFFDFLIGGSVTIHAPSDFASCKKFVIGDNTTIGTATERFKKMISVNVASDCVLKPTTNNTDILDKVTLGIGCTVTTNGDKTNANYINIAGTTYLQGVSGANMTLTAV